MKIQIADIKVADRIRTDAGDIEELAKDIKENGLITPIAVTEDMELLAGWRRLTACKSLGMTEIEANVMSVSDALAKLKVEISENENRKPFTFSEKMRWAEMLKEEYRKTAEENQKRGTSAKHFAEVRDENADSPSVGNQTVGRVSDRVAQDVGMGSGRNFEKAEYVNKFATKEMIAALDAEQLSVNAAYKALKKENERLQSANEMLESLDDKASDQIDALEMDRQRLTEEVLHLRNVISKTSNEDLRKDATDSRLALRDMEEQKVAAEMALARKQEECDRIKASRQAIIDNFERMKAENEKGNDDDPSYTQFMTLLAMLTKMVSEMDISGWTDEMRKSALDATEQFVDLVMQREKSVA